MNPTKDTYDDNILFGSRSKVLETLDRLKSRNDSGAIIYSIGTFADRRQWNLKDLTKLDKRLKCMTEALSIRCLLPIQAFSLPKIDKAFPAFIISPERTGKTFTYLLYCISKCVLSVPFSKTDQMLSVTSECEWKADSDASLNTDSLIHPKYIIVCSSQSRAEIISCQMDTLKSKLYPNATESRTKSLPPTIGYVSMYHEDDKLALRCMQNEILTGSPRVLLQCLKAGYWSFNRCKKVFFDDLDLSLQLQNNLVRDLIKFYLIQCDGCPPSSENVANESCQFYFFCTKWTELVKQFASNVFCQRILIFGSLAEASIYSNLKFELEPYHDDQRKLEILTKIVKNHSTISQDKLAIVCKTDEEADLISRKLKDLKYNIKLYTMNSMPDGRSRQNEIHIYSDGSLSIEVEFASVNRLSTITNHLVHYSLPDSVALFDQRFRLMFRKIQDNEKDLMSTIFIGSDMDKNNAKHIFDLLCRSSTTLHSTKLLIRDQLVSKSDKICWRWGSTGICRLEKFNRDDKLGTFCLDKHSLNVGPNMKWPTGGQVKISITHVISPNEFFFWFEAHRDGNSRKWIKFENSGRKYMESLQVELDKLRDVKPRSVPLTRIIKGQIYGIYFQDDNRVDRVRITNMLDVNTESSNEELEYSKQVEVFKVDHGNRLDVFIKNLIELPPDLVCLDPQCHHAIFLHVKPTYNEPQWPYKSKKAFHDMLCDSRYDTTVWLRLNSDNSFWFEHMVLLSGLVNIESNDVASKEPYKMLCSMNLAEVSSTEPDCLARSTRLETISKWHSDELDQYAQHAVLRHEQRYLKLFLLDVKPDFTLVVRQTQFNKLLVRLEDDLTIDFNTGRAIKQRYIAIGVHCVARIKDGYDSVKKGYLYTLNRAKILRIDDSADSLDASYFIECLDHGDIHQVRGADIYEISVEHLRRLPFQAIRCTLSNVKPEILRDHSVCRRIAGSMIDATRNEDNQMKELLGRFNARGDGLHVYTPMSERQLYMPLTKVVEESMNIEICDVDDIEYESPIEFSEEDEAGVVPGGIQRQNLINSVLLEIINDLARSELEMMQLEVK